MSDTTDYKYEKYMRKHNRYMDAGAPGWPRYAKHSKNERLLDEIKNWCRDNTPEKNGPASNLVNWISQRSSRVKLVIGKGAASQQGLKNFLLAVSKECNNRRAKDISLMIGKLHKNKLNSGAPEPALEKILNYLNSLPDSVEPCGSESDSESESESESDSEDDNPPPPPVRRPRRDRGKGVTRAQNQNPPSPPFDGDGAAEVLRELVSSMLNGLVEWTPKLFKFILTMLFLLITSLRNTFQCLIYLGKITIQGMKVPAWYAGNTVYYFINGLLRNAPMAWSEVIQFMSRRSEDYHRLGQTTRHAISEGYTYTVQGAVNTHEWLIEATENESRRKQKERDQEEREQREREVQKERKQREIDRDRTGQTLAGIASELRARVKEAAEEEEREQKEQEQERIVHAAVNAKAERDIRVAMKALRIALKGAARAGTEAMQLASHAPARARWRQVQTMIKYGLKLKELLKNAKKRVEEKGKQIEADETFNELAEVFRGMEMDQTNRSPDEIVRRRRKEIARLEEEETDLQRLMQRDLPTKAFNKLRAKFNAARKRRQELQNPPIYHHNWQPQQQQQNTGNVHTINELVTSSTDTSTNTSTYR